jgi:hypothetical protein
MKQTNSITPPNGSIITQNKTKIPAVKKMSVPINNNIFQSGNKRKSTNPLAVSLPNAVASIKKARLSAVNNFKPSSTLTMSTPINKATEIKKKKGFNSSQVITGPAAETVANSHKKTVPVNYTTEPSLISSAKSKQKLTTTTANKEKTLSNKKSTGNLTSTLSFSMRKKNLSVGNECCGCDCHSERKGSIKFNGSQNVRKNSQIDSAFNTYRNSMNLSSNINKLNDLHDLNVKSFAELFFIFNDINDINSSNRDKRQMLVSPNQSFFNANAIANANGNTKSNENDLLGHLKNFIYADEALEAEAKKIKNNISINFLKDNLDSEESISVVTIQRKWREFKIKKLLYPLMSLDMTYNKLEKFSFLNCNKKEILKLGKIHLYSSLLRSSEKFKNVLSHMNQAAIIWQDLMKKQGKILFNIFRCFFS